MSSMPGQEGDAQRGLHAEGLHATGPASAAPLDRGALVAERLHSLATLAAGVAHEINNPVAVVIANLRYVAQELEREPSRRAELLGAVEDAVLAADRIREAVERLRRFSREDVDGEPALADAGAVVRATAELVRHELRDRARLELELGEVPRVAASPGRLGQALLDLYLQAAHSIPRGRPEENVVRVTVQPEGSARVAIAVSDTGRGIPVEQLHLVFDPFYAAHPPGPLGGLGLSICYALVTACGGEIRAESAAGKGSTFRLSLPVAEA